MIGRLPDQNVTNVYENIEFGIRSEIDLRKPKSKREKKSQQEAIIIHTYASA